MRNPSPLTVPLKRELLIIWIDEGAMVEAGGPGAGSVFSGIDAAAMVTSACFDVTAGDAANNLG